MTKQNDATSTDTKYVEFAREEQRLFGHTSLEEKDCPPELLAADRAFLALSPAEQQKRKWEGVQATSSIALGPHPDWYFPG